MLTESIQNLKNNLYHKMLHMHNKTSNIYRDSCQQIVSVCFNWNCNQRTFFKQLS